MHRACEGRVEIWHSSQQRTCGRWLVFLMHRHLVSHGAKQESKSQVHFEPRVPSPWQRVVLFVANNSPSALLPATDMLKSTPKSKLAKQTSEASLAQLRLIRNCTSGHCGQDKRNQEEIENVKAWATKQRKLIHASTSLWRPGSHSQASSKSEKYTLSSVRSPRNSSTISR